MTLEEKEGLTSMFGIYTRQDLYAFSDDELEGLQTLAGFYTRDDIYNFTDDELDDLQSMSGMLTRQDLYGLSDDELATFSNFKTGLEGFIESLYDSIIDTIPDMVDVPNTFTAQDVADAMNFVTVGTALF